MGDSFEASQLEVGNRSHELASITALVKSRVVPAHRLSAYIDTYGSSVHLVQLSEDDLLMVLKESSHEVIGAVTGEDLAKSMAEVGIWEESGMDVRSILDSNYPANLRGIFNRPPLLFVIGQWFEDRDSQSIAVVGTRKVSAVGIRRARKLSKELSEAGFTILSGMAMGVDTVAHEAALEWGSRTVTVMGTGVNHRYPLGNRALAQRIVDSGGALVTQFFPEQGPRQWTFPMRNIVMSGLSLATVVVEAGETSGARMQARVALQHGRTVFLLRSLVESHDWAKKYVEEGVYQTKAICISSTNEIVDRLQVDTAKVAALAF